MSNFDPINPSDSAHQENPAASLPANRPTVVANQFDPAANTAATHGTLPELLLAKTPAPLPNVTRARQSRLALLALRQQRLRALQNILSLKFQEGRFRAGVVIGLSILFWIGLFCLFYEGFAFLNTSIKVSTPIVEMLFGLFFLSLLMMLTFSTGIILYAGAFASKEADYLLVLPVPTDLVFRQKFEDAMFFSCWGFLLLGSPMMIAYGLNANAPWYFYGLALFYFLGFALIPGSLGALLCLAITLLTPKRRWEVLAALGTVLLLACLVGLYRLWQSSGGVLLTRQWLVHIVQNLQISQLPMLPTLWMSRGLVASGVVEQWQRALFYLAVLWANGLFFYLITASFYRQYYRMAYNRIHSESFGSARRTHSWFSESLSKLFVPFSTELQLLVEKDLKGFCRDPRQWLQGVIFVGLLIIYFVILSRMTYYKASPYWTNMLGFFNIAVTALIMSAFTSRFVFPMMSLEGQTFWVLGLSPLSRARILWGKFAFSAGCCLVVTWTLTVLSGWLLELSIHLILIQLFTVSVLGFGISGISVGLGAKFPNMKEQDPSKIASGFGGTLNLIANLFFIFLILFTIALPCHFYSIMLTLQQGRNAIDAPVLTYFQLTYHEYTQWLGISMFLTLVQGLIATFLPMRLGIAAFRRMEF